MKGTTAPECPVCRSNAGIDRISPGKPVHEGEHWVIEHAYPTSLPGWLVIVLKRHVEALHELTRAEGEELGRLQWAVSRALSAETGCMKEYAVFFAERANFSHVHVHMVPRAHDLDRDFLGGRIFAHLKPGPSDVLKPDEVTRICEQLGSALRSELGAESA